LHEHCSPWYKLRLSQHDNSQMLIPKEDLEYAKDNNNNNNQFSDTDI